ncbi:MAG TPA: DUF2334 domain-containing protein [Polyangiaceae bacterium]|nr:DUF2334 domain-containing protein [Polyangiaceae bacterium]
MNLGHFLLPAQGRLGPEDLRVLARVAALLPESWHVGNVQPSRGEQRALPRFEALSARTWDLSWRSASPHDALIAARLSGLPGDRERRLRSALASCRVLVVLDAAATELPSERLLGVVPAPGGNLRLYRGELTDPLLRVDDYPTGVRPILEDLTPLHDVLSRIDDSGLAFHLGVVPAILSDDMASFLRGLKHLVVCMHGYEHGYAKHSKILIAAGDPFNQRSTVTGFDEFSGQPYAEIASTLQKGRLGLESRLGQTPLCYIPPNNLANRATGRALVATGFEYVLTERRIPGCALPCIASDFYDRSPAFRPGSSPNVASLHATWEADLRGAGDSESLPRFLADLAVQRTRARDQAAQVAEAVAAGVARG